MAPNEENPRRDPHRPEDNPFIAFRRFADSQVSSLLNTVFALPATISNYNNAHRAREQCLFGKADKKQCAELHELESTIAELRHEAQEQFRAGDMQAVLRFSEEMMRLDRKADELRQDMVTAFDRFGGDKRIPENDARLVERVANEKGQEWGWSWDWGFPRPFDHDNKGAGSAYTAEEEERRARQYLESTFLQSGANEKLGEDRVDELVDSMMQAFLHEAGFQRNKTEQRSEEDTPSSEPRVWSWSKSWQWPPPADSNRIDDEAYSPHALEQDPDLKGSSVPWKKAYEELLHAEQNENTRCMRRHRHWNAERRHRWGRHRRGWVEQEGDQDTLARESKDVPQSEDEPSYEYGHDHEDQHEEPPTPKFNQQGFSNRNRSWDQEQGQEAVEDEHDQDSFSHHQQREQEHLRTSEDEEETTTELDAYEQLFGTKAMSFPPSEANQPANGAKSASILSTLTTTERTVAPDGSVTTKMVLKKRFADGREESSETVQTQHSQASKSRLQNTWNDDTDKQHHSSPQNGKAEDKRKGGGWFWSS